MIGRCLTTILSNAREGFEFQIIVAANGCSDRTVEIARATAPQALVLDLPEGSKTRAMNAAHRKALHYPLIFLDADIQCDFISLAAVAQALREPGVLVAAPALKMDLSRSNSLVKSYYRVWLSQPYATDAIVGSGCFGLSEAAYRRIGDFPDIIGDDIWVHSQFERAERRSVCQDLAGRPVKFVVSPPRRVVDQIRVETRRRRGNEQLRSAFPGLNYAGSNRPGDLRDALKAGATLADIAIYLAVKAAAGVRASLADLSGKTIVWERDTRARET